MKFPSLTRRQFSQLAALSAAASALPAQQAPVSHTGSGTAVKPVGFAAVGLGGISEIFMRAVAQVPDKARITGLVTGHPAEKGPRYAGMYNVPQSSVYTYDTYNRIRDNHDIEAVYIGLPNSMHCDFTVRAAEAGKHVLCEKPMAISSAECRKMIDACKAANVRLMIAYRVHYDPTYTHALELVKSGALGQIQAFEGAFIGTQPRGAWRLTRTLGGGGSLMDLGIYPLNAIRYMAGEEPSQFAGMVATRDTSGKFAEVEQTVEWTMKFPSGILATGGSSYGGSGESTLFIHGDKGWLQIQPAYGYDGVHLKGHTTQGPIDDLGTGKAPFQFALEATHFADCIRLNQQPRTPGEEGLADLLAIEAIYKSAGTPIA